MWQFAFALLALICFILALAGIAVAGLDLVVLGLVFVAAYLLVAHVPAIRGRSRN